MANPFVHDTRLHTHLPNLSRQTRPCIFFWIFRTTHTPCFRFSIAGFSSRLLIVAQPSFPSSIPFQNFFGGVKLIGRKEQQRHRLPRQLLGHQGAPLPGGAALRPGEAVRPQERRAHPAPHPHGGDPQLPERRRAVPGGRVSAFPSFLPSKSGSNPSLFVRSTYFGRARAASVCFCGPAAGLGAVGRLGRASLARVEHGDLIDM